MNSPTNTERCISLPAPVLVYRYPKGTLRAKTFCTSLQALTAFRQACKPSSKLPAGTIITVLTLTEVREQIKGVTQ